MDQAKYLQVGALGWYLLIGYTIVRSGSIRELPLALLVGVMYSILNADFWAIAPREYVKGSHHPQLTLWLFYVLAFYPYGLLVYRLAQHAKRRRNANKRGLDTV